MFEKIVYILLIVIFLITTGNSQSFTASANKAKVPVNQVFTLTYKIAVQGARNFVPPDLTAFQVVSGPNQSSNMSLVDGRMTQSISLSYQLKLKVQKIGVTAIWPATVQVKGKSIKSNSVSIDFTKAAKKANPDDEIIQQLKETIHLVLSVNKSNVYVGEQLVATYKLYFNTNISGITDYSNVPSFSSFWNQEFELKPNDVQQVTYKGQKYYMSVLKKVLLTPQKSGELTVERLGVELVARVKVKSRSFFSNTKDIKHTVKSSSRKIQVKALPKSGKPSDFNGAVGKFTLEPKITKTEAETNEAISLIIKVKGSGNLSLFDTPELNIPPDIETYEPKISDNIQISNKGNSGSKTFEYVLIPRYAGAYKIPSVSFSYFDLEQEKYISLSTPDYTLKIEGEAKGNKGSQEKEVSYSNKDEVTLLGEDVLFIKTNSASFKAIDSYYFKSGLFYFLIFFPLAVTLFIGLFFKRQKTLNQDMAYVKRKRANKLTKKRLSVAKKYLLENNSSQFYEELSNAIWGYFSDKINIPPSEISNEKIDRLLSEKGIAKETTTELMEIIEQCEFARFAPGSVSDNLSDVYEKTANIITKIDDTI
jgi:hypothetical protein